MHTHGATANVFEVRAYGTTPAAWRLPTTRIRYVPRGVEYSGCQRADQTLPPSCLRRTASAPSRATSFQLLPFRRSTNTFGNQSRATIGEPPDHSTLTTWPRGSFGGTSVVIAGSGSSGGVSAGGAPLDALAAVSSRSATAWGGSGTSVGLLPVASASTRSMTWFST